MNAVDVVAWHANWAWSLPSIVLNVVIHVIGLGLINESVVCVLSGARDWYSYLHRAALLLDLREHDLPK